MSVKTKSIAALFVALVIILAVNPKVVNNIYGSFLGRLFLVGIVIFLTMNNKTLGLLATLAIITALNQFGSLVEGMENETPTTIGDNNDDTTGSQPVLTKDSVNNIAKKRISELKQTTTDETIGVNKEDIKTAIMSKNSKTIPVDKNMTSSTEVAASSSSMLNPSSSTLEGFSSYAPVY
jgi:hypothetical protein